MTTAQAMVAAAKAQISEISPSKASEEIRAGGAVVLDVREPVEWEHHIADAVQVPRGLLEFVADPASARHHEALAPERRTIVYCNSGGRSALAAQTLEALGFTDVASLAGGFTAWRDAGLPTIGHHDDL